ncbi:MAG TPA: hypothetical protein VIK50_07840 [Gemmatimonadaceae bacterium]
MATYPDARELAAGSSALDGSMRGYHGEYELAPTFSIAISREGAALFEQPTGQPAGSVFRHIRSYRPPYRIFS